MKILGLFACLLSFFCTGCTSLQSLQNETQQSEFLSMGSLSDRPETSSDFSDGITASIAAHRVAEAYRTVPYYRFIGTITQKSLTDVPLGMTGPYFIVVEMAKSKHNLLVTDPSRTILENATVEGRFYERWSMNGNTIYSVPSPFPQGSDNVLKEANDLVECIGCLVGSCLSSWVGDYSGMKGANKFTDQPLRFKQMIERSKRLPDARLLGRDCRVFKDTIPVGNDEKGKPQFITHTLYLDKPSYFVVGWETAQPDVLRTRHYEICWSDYVPTLEKWYLNPQVSKLRIIPRIKD